MDLRKIQELVYEEYIKNGFKDFWDKAKQLGDLGEIGLVTTEVTECLECIRNSDYKKLPYELADIVIRVLNIATRKGYDLQDFIIKNYYANKERPKKHGRKFI